MSLSDREWIWPACDQGRANELAREINAPPALARLLLKRGIEDSGQAGAFLCPSTEQLYPPGQMLGMEEAVARLLEAIGNDEKIIIHGDYDADGISATVIMVEALNRLGARVDYFLPSRFEEGYGLHIEPLKMFKEDGASLVVTVDCGINAVREAAYASEIGLDLIITDHHQPIDLLPEALSVINPLQRDCPYPFKDLSGAGIAFKLAVALAEKAGRPFPLDLLDLAALGTAADVVPLVDENRVIVAAGLEVLRGLKRIGFRALAGEVRLEPSRINSSALSFILAPAVNAAGRMGEALPAARLLLEDDEAKAEVLAAGLHRSNLTRRATEQKILAEAVEAAEKLLDAEDTKIITLAAESWHHGVIGIVASRLVEKFHRPVALVAIEDGRGRGSARSIPGFDITAALAGSASLLERFGGHDQAAGFTVDKEKISRLRDSLNCYARANLDENSLKAKLYLDAGLEEHEINSGLAGLLEQLQPFGTGNPRPLFGSRDWEIVSWRPVGADKQHLKISVQKGGRLLDTIMFAGAGLERLLEKGRRADLAFRLKNGFFREKETLEIELKDLSYSDSVTCENIEIIDRRGSNNRAALAKEILGREKGAGILFAATVSRANQVKAACPGGKTLHLVTSGGAQGEAELHAAAEALFLYDLPLHESMVEEIFRSRSGGKQLKVYLLYDHPDQERNSRLTELSLPSAEALETIIAGLLQTANTGAKIILPGQVGRHLGYKPVKRFWDRVGSILNEIGLLEEGGLLSDSAAIMKTWPACLESSPTYIECEELSESCEHFQRLLLDGTPEEICLYFKDLSGI